MPYFGPIIQKVEQFGGLSFETARKLVEALEVSDVDCVLDLASGGGRIAAGIANTRTKVLATDIKNNFNILKDLEHESGWEGYVKTEVLEGTVLPYCDGSFKAITVAHAMYLVPEYQSWLKEIVRVLRFDGRFAHNWGNGSPGDLAYEIREKLRTILEDMGEFMHSQPGARSESEIESELISMGLTLENCIPEEPTRKYKVSVF